MSQRLRLQLLGPVIVEWDEEQVNDFESWKALALLCYVAVLRRPVSRVHLVDLFWPDKTEQRGRSNLSRVLHNIRSLLPGVAEADRQTITFNQDIDCWLDIVDFESLIERGDAKSLVRAAALFRDEFMADIYPDGCQDFEIWLAVEREQWRQRTMHVLDSLVRYHLYRGEYEEGLEYVNRALTLERWREEAYRQKMQLLSLSGQRSAALAQYDNCRQALEEELGVEPEAETVELYERIRNEHPPTNAATPATSRRTSKQQSQSMTVPFVGRGDEHTWLVEQWYAVQDKGSRFTFVEGESGLGKTRLVNEVLKYLQQAGASILRGHCYEFGTEIPYQSIVPVLREAAKCNFTLSDVWLAELATLLPELRDRYPNLPTPLQANGEAARQRLFESVARLVLALADAGDGISIFLDDIHLADQATLDLLYYLFHRLLGEPIWILCTYRPEEVPSAHPLNRIRRTGLQEGRIGVLRLDPLSTDDIVEIIQALPALDAAESELLIEYLVEESEGNAFILIQLLQDLVERSILKKRDGKWGLDQERFTDYVREGENDNYIPIGVRDLVVSRVERLSPSATDLLELAAVVGQRVRVPLLREASMRDTHVASAVEELVNRRLLAYSGADELYEFAHSMIQSVVYDTLSLVRRQELHGRIASALERLFAGDESRVVERLAFHFLEAGDKEQALRYYRKAAERAEQIFAWETAIRHYTQVLHLLPAGNLTERYDVLARREWAYNIIADHHAQEADLRALAELAERLDDYDRRGEVFCRQTKLALRRGQFAAGIMTAARVLALADHNLRTDVVAESCRLGALCLQNQGEYEAAREWGERALALYEHENNRQGRPLALNTLGIIARSSGHLQDARIYMEEAVEEWRRLDDVWRLATGLSTLSMLYYRVGEYDAALDAQLEARNLAPQTGDLHLEASSLNSLGLIYHAHGRYAEAMKAFAEALPQAQAAGAPKIEAAVLLSQAHTLLDLNKVDEAEQSYRQSLEIQKNIDIPVLRVETLNGLADCYLARGDANEALALLGAAETFHQSAGRPGYTETLIRKAEANLVQSSAEETGRFAEELVCLLEQSDRERPSMALWQRVTRLLEEYGDTSLIERVDRLSETHVAGQ